MGFIIVLDVLRSLQSYLSVYCCLYFIRQSKIGPIKDHLLPSKALGMNKYTLGADSGRASKL